MSRGLDLASKCMTCLNNGNNVNNEPCVISHPVVFFQQFKAILSKYHITIIGVGVGVVVVIVVVVVVVVVR